MEYRTFGRTGWKVSAIGFGACGIGGDVWGPTDDKTSLATVAKKDVLVDQSGARCCYPHKRSI